MMTRSVRHGMHISPAPFRHCAGRKANADSIELPPMPSLPDAVQGEILFHAAFMHVQARYPFMQASPHAHRVASKADLEQWREWIHRHQHLILTSV